MENYLVIIRVFNPKESLNDYDFIIKQYKADHIKNLLEILNADLIYTNYDIVQITLIS